MFYNGIGLFSYCLVFPENMQRLGPKPLGRINASFVGRVVDLPLAAQFVDLIRLGDGRVVFQSTNMALGFSRIQAGGPAAYPFHR